MIKWAREDAGLTLEDLPVILKDAEKWETGELKPTWVDLRNLAKKYKRPSFFYLLPDPPKEQDDFIEFRSDDKIEEFSSNLRLEIRKAKFRRNAVIKINNNMGINHPNFSNFVSNNKNPIELAQHIRNILNVPFDDQKKWILNDKANRDYSHNNFLNHWKEIFSDLGILVFETEKVSEDEISGCSLYYDNYPIILLNGKNTPNRRIFTLIHELTHLIQGKSAICDVDKHNKKEAFCNKVTAEVLVPQDTLNKVTLFTKKEEPKLDSLSHIYGVSKQTIVYRLNSLDYIDNDIKDKIINILEEKNQRDKQKKKEQNTKGSPKLSTSTRKKKYDGIPYVKLVLNAYENNIITAPQAIRYLEMPLDKFEIVDKEIWG